jgi:alanyl-tRNA synthetase
MMEQVLSARIMEVAPPTGGVPPVAGATATGAVTSAPVNPADAAKQQALMAAQQVQKKKEIQDQIKMKQQEIIELQKQMNMPMAETRQSLRRRLRESEVQQAQVVLASQDMVDQVQKMSEQISAMQFKDLPALVDQIKNEVGVDQAMQFNTDSTAALAGLLQNLQVAKQQLEQALGVVTGQAAVVPGEDLGGELPPAELGGEELPPELPAPDEDVNPAGSSLGRGRR